MLRRLRHWVTARVTDAAVWAAPHLSIRALDALGTLLARCGPYCPVIARSVADSMRALGVYSGEVHHAYFAQLGAHLAGALHAFRCTSRAGLSAELARLAIERVELDESVAGLHAAANRGRGLILMGPHITNYLLNLARLNQEIPLTVYLRYSKDAQRRAAKQRWYQASGVGWISQAATAGGTLGRLGAMSAALREGHVLFITPDVPQKRDRGTPVRFFNREIYLPAGPALLAERTGAPLFMLTAGRSGPRQRLTVQGPFVVEQRRRGPAGRRAAVQQRLQWFAACLEQFLRQQTPLWYLWGDKRWTRLLHGDPRYVRSLDEPAAGQATAVPAGASGMV